jgi:lysophospholipase L1-like esterase
MVAFCLAGSSWLLLKHKRGWVPLIACLAILLVKRPDWSPLLTTLAFTMVVVAVFAYRKKTISNSSSLRHSWVPIALLWTMWALAVWEMHASTHTRTPLVFDLNRSVVCIGDSLTAGVAEASAYPAYLRELLSVPVVDLGRPGISTGDALQHLSEILDARPQVVIIELGGNDFVRGYSRAETRANLVRLIDASQQLGTQVVLVEIPRGFIIDPYSGLERELARKLDLELIADTAIRTLVLRSPTSPLPDSLARPHLSDDGLHPNPAGARYLAAQVCESLIRMYGPSITAEDR